MRGLLTSLRSGYFHQVASSVSRQDIQLVILTHVLDDRPELIDALSEIAPISLVVAVPYSIHSATLDELSEQHKIVTPSLDQLFDREHLKKTLLDHVDHLKPVVILEIGGYFAPALEALHQVLGDRLVGVIEDTEAGHRAYEIHADSLPCPVVSVARSQLKETEDFLVGASCLYSTEKLLRSAGFPIEGKRSLVLGFGKIGRGISHSLLRHHCPVLVYDVNPIRRISALSEGFQVPARAEALSRAEIIYGTTGMNSIKADDFKHVNNGALLVSCSSKDIEFDLKALSEQYQKTSVFEGLDRYERDNQVLYLAANGWPINFSDGAVIGPVLALVQSEIIIAIDCLLKLKAENKKGLFETDAKMQETLANQWLAHFCDEYWGRYRHV